MVEKLWKLGSHYHQEGSDALTAWVEELKALVYEGKAKRLVRHLKKLLGAVPPNGPGTKARRKALKSVIGYLRSRLAMMRYREWLNQDLVIATGQVEGAVRYLVGERFDCAGMRWVKEKAEALLHLRCIELNGDWQTFVSWFQRTNQHRLGKGERCKVLTDQPLKLKKAA